MLCLATAPRLGACATSALSLNLSQPLPLNLSLSLSFLHSSYKDGDLNVGETSCVDRCASKYWQVRERRGKERGERDGGRAGACLALLSVSRSPQAREPTRPHAPLPLSHTPSLPFLPSSSTDDGHRRPDAGWRRAGRAVKRGGGERERERGMGFFCREGEKTRRRKEEKEKSTATTPDAPRWRLLPPPPGPPRDAHTARTHRTNDR